MKWMAKMVGAKVAVAEYTIAEPVDSELTATFEITGPL